MKHTIHLYYAVHIRMEGIEADSQEAAIEIAAQECDVRESINRGAAEWDEGGHLGALADEELDEGYLRTRYHEGPGAKNYLAIEGAETKKLEPQTEELLELCLRCLREDEYPNLREQLRVALGVSEGNRP